MVLWWYTKGEEAKAAIIDLGHGFFLGRVRPRSHRVSGAAGVPHHREHGEEQLWVHGVLESRGIGAERIKSWEGTF